MLVSQFVPAVVLAATRKVYTFTTVTDTKAAVIIAIANQLIADYENEPDVDWNSLYLPNTSIGTVTATASYTLTSTIRKISSQQGDVVRILHTDGVTFTDYDIISADQDKYKANYAPTYQDNYITITGRTLRFHRAFASTDPQFGGTIYVPAYGYAGPGTPPTYLAASTDVIPVDLPNWLVYATAAQYDASDVTRQQLVPRLEAKANELMQVMKDNNDGQLSDMYQPWRPGQLIPGEIGLP